MPIKPTSYGRPQAQTQKTTQKITRGWPPKRRAEQARRLQKAKIWLKSTGPKSLAGKARVAKNAFKHGCDSVEFKQQVKILRYLLRKQREFLKQYKRQRYVHYVAGLSYAAACPSPTYAQSAPANPYDAQAS